MLECLKIWFYVTCFHILLDCSVFQFHSGKEQSFASEIINKTRLELRELTNWSNTNCVMRSKFPFLSFHLVHLGPNFHFPTCKALTSEEGACLVDSSSCWHYPPLRVPSVVVQTAQLPLKQVLNPMHNSNVICDYLVLSECKSGEVQQLLHKAKTMGRVWKGGHLRIIISTSFPSCQDTRSFICNAITVWAVLAEYITGKVLYWTMQVLQNSICRLVGQGL